MVSPTAPVAPTTGDGDADAAHSCLAISGCGSALGMRGMDMSPTSPHCARWRSAWSISTSATIASQIGVARMPTQGSWRPVVTTSTHCRATSTLSTGRRRLEVGLNATEQRTGWPVEMPPRMPPAWLRSEALAAHLVAVLAALLRHDREAGADLDALDRVDAHHRRGEFAVELAVDRLAPARRHAVGDHVDARADRIAGLAQRVHVRLQLGHLRARRARRTDCPRPPTRSKPLRHDVADLRKIAAHARCRSCSRQPLLGDHAPRPRASWSRARDERPPPRGSRMPYFCQ